MTGPATTGRPPAARQGGRPRRPLLLTRRGRNVASAALAVGISLAAAGTTALIAAPSGKPAYVDIGTLPAQPGSGDTAATTESAAPPIRIRIGRIALDKPLTGLRVQQDGRLGVPQDPAEVGWWSDGPRPGDPGAAVVVGHVDSTTGPGAFHGLSSLRPGDQISVRRDDRSTVAFTVQALRQYDKDSLPDSQVYATTGPPALRLITCGGSYDRKRGEYSHNLVVYATLEDAD
ncbi:class F sortase [Streptomyces sp. ISL-99]|uniref:class F sortase n=1 Tax=Streptomyces sp. ISL-99 TaxID=2819193 RepID=UPI001BECEEBD|nr:class F sortase [Streptomyces sp. ISL-99]MBT2529358.1 class F sortase [Streptomyces sp. ISL-99]